MRPTTITVYRSKDDSGADYQSPPVKSRHTSLAAAVKSATISGIRSGQYVIIREADERQFILIEKYGAGCAGGRGEWIDGINDPEQVEF